MSEQKTRRVDGVAVREDAVARGETLREAAVREGDALRQRAVAHAAGVMERMTGSARPAPAPPATIVSETLATQSVPATQSAPATLATADDYADTSTQPPAAKTETAGV